MLGISEMIKDISAVLENYKATLIESYNEASNYHDRYVAK